MFVNFLIRFFIIFLVRDHHELFLKDILNNTDSIHTKGNKLFCFLKVLLVIKIERVFILSKIIFWTRKKKKTILSERVSFFFVHKSFNLYNFLCLKKKRLTCSYLGEAHNWRVHHSDFFGCYNCFSNYVLHLIKFLVQFWSSKKKIPGPFYFFKI